MCQTVGARRATAVHESAVLYRLEKLVRKAPPYFLTKQSYEKRMKYLVKRSVKGDSSRERANTAATDDHSGRLTEPREPVVAK